MMRPTHLLVATVLVGLGACSALRPAPPMDRDAEYRLDRGLDALDAGRYAEAFDDLAWVHAHCPGTVRGAEALVALAALELDPRNAAARPAVGSDLLGRALRDPAPPTWVRPLAETSYLMALSLGAPPASDLVVNGTPADGPERTLVAEEPVVVIRDTQQAAAADDAPPAAVGAPRVGAADVLPRPVEDPADEPARGCGARVRPGDWAAPRLPDLPGTPLVALLSAAETSRNEATSRAESLREEVGRLRRQLQETEAELERIRRTLKP